MLRLVEPTKPLDRVFADLETAVGRHNFGVLRVHDLKAATSKKGVAFDRDCCIFRICSPH